MPNNDRNSTGIRIRSYNVGFGDCFLVTFPDGDLTRNMLIDFGCAPGQSTVQFSSIVENIYEETNGRLDVVVATNELLDHISGFSDQKRAFKRFEIDYVWMGISSSLGYVRRRPGSLLTDFRRLGKKFLNHARKNKIKLAPTFETLILNNLRTEAQVNAVRNLASNQRRLLYLERGEDVTDKPFSDNISVEVLAPEADFDTYVYGNEDYDLYDELQELYSIDDRMGARLDASKKKVHPFFSNGDFHNVNCIEDPTNISSFDWRLIQNKNAVFGVNELRSIDAAVGNTSLVLLMTIGEKKLLFTGDAQWRSWEEILDSNERATELESIDFLKLSQHGSQTGTPEIFTQLKPSTKIMVSTKIDVYGTKYNIPDAGLFNELRTKHGDNFIVNEPGSGELWVDAEL